MGMLDSLREIFARVLGRKPNNDNPAELPTISVAMAELQRYQDVFKTHVEELTRQLVAGQITEANWRLNFEQELRYLHVAAQAIGIGGFANMDASDLRAAGNAVEQQLTFLDRWLNSMVLPTGINESYAIARAKMYAGAATATMNAARTVFLGLKLPQVPGDGQTECLTNCRCHLDVRIAEGVGNYDVFWLVDIEAEHCPDCLRLAELWTPLRVRNGHIE